MVRIRLRRMGSKHKPSYRVVVADARAPRDGRFIETIGHYNPQQQPKVVVIKQDRARYWLGVGAQPSDTVVRLLKVVGVFDTEGKLAPETAEVAPVAEAPTRRSRTRKTTGSGDATGSQGGDDASLAQAAAEETAVEA